MTRRASAAALVAWFAAQGWKPAPFQQEVWRHWQRGTSGLLVTPTGSGKTLAVLGGALLDGLGEAAAPAPVRGRDTPPRLRLLWVTPLRALATDTAQALQAAITGVGLTWTVAKRTGDASSRDRRLARRGQAEVLVITPESLALLLSYPDSAAPFAGLRGMVVDEWHELLGNKRGVLLQLGLARLRALAPSAPVWGLSATLGNLEEARDVLLPHQPDAPIVRNAPRRTVTLRTLLPEAGERFPWSGHLGLSQLERVLQLIAGARSAILFTNTRAQAELWHRALSSVWLEDPGTLALHHGSLDVGLRQAAEQGLRDGSVRCVVATSSLDLGVDFPAVDLVLQVGSPKGIARLLQRAGRAHHRPGAPGLIHCVPTHALELAEIAAARRAIAAGQIETRPPPRLSLDVLAQHCVTLALGAGFEAGPLLAEVRGTHAFAALSDAQWQAVLQYIERGGQALENYPDFHRVVRDADGIYRVTARRIALHHRLSIGTITADGSVQVRFLRGASLGSVEESFISRLRPRDRFQFAGRTLELVAVEDMTAYVRKARLASVAVPRWQGGRMPLSTELGAAVEAALDGPRDSPEMRRLAPLLDLQARTSALPTPATLLVEAVHLRRGGALFVYPFAGRTVHEGMAALFALRWGRRTPNTFVYAVNDYGFALTHQQPARVDAALLADLLSSHELMDDLREGMNLTEMARRQFREIARVAGMLTPTVPGRAQRSLRQVQASSGLLFDVLRRYDPTHVLLAQAEREVFEAQLDISALSETFARCAARRIDLRQPDTLTPLSFPLWAEMVRGELSTEDWAARVRRAAEELQARHG
ncbi:ligase-associated DNA damage response DEXH box helicase [Hydrogenophaga sp. BPS33]|uniref:ligase-associated DNA damage response DEXH box helicase n=1 Tax=Hydrogenophaga sp. BPS33 TaxID=2651974 RepID=UPI0013201619|nr:ligase-associated DNA damage response DEXH box helicase [Hydrogenophaga sp. BPS33]QHE86753.1 ligase-associated DNA damage response DEXH box helicase [Hydrogenophaga sp. BPS33]